MKLRVNMRVLKGMAIGLSVLVILMAMALLLRTLDEDQGRETAPDASSNAEGSSSSALEEAGDTRELTYYNGGWYARRDDLETILLMGLDKYADTEESTYVNNQQADFLMLLVMNKDTGACTPIQLNRDTMTKIQILGVRGDVAGTFTGQLALAHTYGSGERDSCLNTAEAVSNLLYGITIDHYISVTMDGVSILNDAVGGVPVEVMDDFSAIDPTLVQGETVTLRGEQALTYVRSRGSLEDSTNLHRMERQRQYLTSLQEKLNEKAAEDPWFITNTLLKVSNYLVSDCTANQLSQIAETLQSDDVSEIRTIDGEAKKGAEFMEFYPDEEDIQSLVMDVFYEQVKKD